MNKEQVMDVIDKWRHSANVYCSHKDIKKLKSKFEKKFKTLSKLKLRLPSVCVYGCGNFRYLMKHYKDKHNIDVNKSISQYDDDKNE